MAARIIWSTEAADDLERIVEFIARDSPRYGAQVAADVLEAMETASSFPRIGRLVPELRDDDVREVLVYGYRILYCVLPEAIQIGAIVHGARELPRAIEDRAI